MCWPLSTQFVQADTRQDRGRPGRRNVRKLPAARWPEGIRRETGRRRSSTPRLHTKGRQIPRIKDRDQNFRTTPFFVESIHFHLVLDNFSSHYTEPFGGAANWDVEDEKEGELAIDAVRQK